MIDELVFLDWWIDRPIDELGILIDEFMIFHFSYFVTVYHFKHKYKWKYHCITLLNSSITFLKIDIRERKLGWNYFVHTNQKRICPRPEAVLHTTLPNTSANMYLPMCHIEHDLSVNRLRISIATRPASWCLWPLVYRLVTIMLTKPNHIISFVTIDWAN